jgi:hypothetical protein
MDGLRDELFAREEEEASLGWKVHALSHGLPRGLDLLYALALVGFRRVSWLLFGARQYPSFLDSNRIRF